MRSKPHVFIQGISELIGTSVLMLFGIGAILLFSVTPLGDVVSNEVLQRLFIGASFGAAIILVSHSRLGAYSGAQLNPAVTLWQRLRNKCSTETMLIYWLAQCAGSALTIWLLYALFPTAMSKVGFGMTNPGAGFSSFGAVGSEFIATFILLLTIYVISLSKQARKHTAVIVAAVVTALVVVEAPISGASFNPARSFGPAFIAHQFSSYWIYVVGPLLAPFVLTTLTKKR